jgi:hypothetical protein
MAAPWPERGLVLFLGAGASAPSPTNLPPFLALTNQLLEQLDWQSDRDRAEYRHRGYPVIRPPTEGGPAPEVVFRTLHRLSVPFAEPVASAFAAVTPNAVHHAAANLLRRGGSVWTTNFDLGVETAAACDMDVALGRPPEGTDYVSLVTSGPGVLVKFHGTAAAPTTMAFTDWELVTPLANDVVDRMCRVVDGAHLVFYGYRGADPDLADLLDTAMAVASQVTWLVADSGAMDSVTDAFPGAPIAFRPDVGQAPDFDACAKAFLEVVEPYGLLEGVDTTGLFEHRDLARVEFGVGDFRVPEIVHAELVERFGMPGDRHTAYRNAFLRDLFRPRRLRRVWRRYGRQGVASSLYDGWLVSGVIRISVAMSRYRVIQALANFPVARRYRDLVLDKGPALLLRTGQWAEIRRLTEHALVIRRIAGGPLPADLYYHGHALRYGGEIHAARQDQEAAEPGLAGRTGHTVDPERLAGTILEQGILDLYVGRFNDALHRGWDLRERRGRFAVRRWRAWGHWLSGIASVFRLDLSMAEEHLREAGDYFKMVREWPHLADVQSAQLLLVRVRMALRVVADMPDQVDKRHLSTRQRDDLLLVEADIAIAQGDVERAGRLAGQVSANPSNVMAELWSEFVLGELARRDGRGSRRLVAVRDRAHQRGALWLELQALRALAKDGAAATSDIEALEANMQLPSYDALRDPLPLWSLT